MQGQDLKLILWAGNTDRVALIGCRDGIGQDAYRAVCSFLNGSGGDIYLGVEEDGSICGLEARAVPGILKEFIRTAGDPAEISPPAGLLPEILAVDGRTVIAVHVPESPSVHTYRGVIYERQCRQDVPSAGTEGAAAVYARKRAAYTEQQIFPYLRREHLRTDLLQRAREMAVSRYGGGHPWRSMGDDELMKSAGLYTEDFRSGEKGYNLAAVLLLGRDSAIMSACPGYRTDAIAWNGREERGERLVIRTNLIESYDRLSEFVCRRLKNRGTEEGAGRFGRNVCANDGEALLKDSVIHELIVNMLIHRELSSALIARLILDQDKIALENASRPSRESMMYSGSLPVCPKNPLIADFFRNIGLAEQAGCGMEELERYRRLYDGKILYPQDGDIFRVVLPLGRACAAGAHITRMIGEKVGDNVKEKVGVKMPGPSGAVVPEGNVIGRKRLTAHQEHILRALREEPALSARELSAIVGISSRKIEENIRKLKAAGLLFRLGSPKKGYWKVKD